MFPTYTLPLSGRTAIEKSTVPTPLTAFVPLATRGGLALASIRNTSSSGKLKGTNVAQLRPISSFHCPVAELNFTIRPVEGGFAVDPGGGGGNPPFAATTLAGTVVVRSPE